MLNYIHRYYFYQLNFLKKLYDNLLKGKIWKCDLAYLLMEKNMNLHWIPLEQHVQGSFIFKPLEMSSSHLSRIEEGSIHLPMDVCPSCLAGKSMVSSITL